MSYSMFVGLGNAASADVKSNTVFLVLISGQMVTIGNGISTTKPGGSVKLKVIGMSRQSIHMLCAAEPHNQSETPSAIIHHNLIDLKILN